MHSCCGAEETGHQQESNARSQRTLYRHDRIDLRRRNKLIRRCCLLSMAIVVMSAVTEQFSPFFLIDGPLL